MGVEAREVRKTMGFRKEPAAKTYIPYSYHLTDTVISTTTGSYLKIYRLRGRPHDCASDRDLVFWLRDLNQLIKSIGTEHVKIWTHLHHHQAEAFPEKQFKLKFAQHFHDTYRASFRDRPAMVNDLYLTVVYDPVGDSTQKIFASLEKPSRAALDELQEEALDELQERCNQLENSLKSYGVEPLGIYYRDHRGQPVDATSRSYSLEDLGIEGVDLTVDPEDPLAETVEGIPDQDVSQPAEIPRSARAFSSALEWLGYLCNGKMEPVPVCRDRICNYLMDTRPVSSIFGDVIELRSIDEKRYTAGIEVVDYDESTEPGQLNLLMEADFEFVLTQSFCCMSHSAAKGFLSRQQKAMLETKDRSRSQISGMDQAADDIASRRFVMGFHHATLHTYGSDPKAVQKNASRAKTLFSDCGLKAAPIGMASTAAYWARLPGNHAFVPRPAAINSWNFVSFNSLHNYMSGKPHDNPWGESLMQVRTAADTPVHLNFHASHPAEKSFNKRPPGNTLLLGRVGAGKTTLFNAMLTFATQYNSRMFVFDKDLGMYPLVKFLGGRYTVLKDGESTGWSPAQLPPTRPNIKHVKQLVRVCCEVTNQGPIDQLDVERINKAVDHVMASGIVPVHLRDFTAISQQITTSRSSASTGLSLGEMLKPWTRAGEIGWLFDNVSDNINLQTHDVFGFDLTEFIVAKGQPSPIARTPMLMYLFYRMRQSIDGTRRTLIAFDEFAQYLDDPVLEVEIKRGLKTDRKRDCPYLFATQEANDALESRIGKTVVEQCVTKILLENPDARRADYCEGGLNLTEAEYQAMLNIPEHSRQFLYKQGTQSTIAVMDLKGMDDVISVLSGTPDNAAKLMQIIDEYGDDPEIFMPKYWRAVL